MPTTNFNYIEFAAAIIGLSITFGIVMNQALNLANAALDTYRSLEPRIRARHAYLYRTSKGILCTTFSAWYAYLIGAQKWTPNTDINSIPVSLNVFKRALVTLARDLTNPAIEPIRTASLDLSSVQQLHAGVYAVYFDGRTEYRYLTATQANWLLAYGYQLSYEVKNKPVVKPVTEPATTPASKLEAFKAYIQYQITVGNTNAAAILADIKSMGYTGSYTILKDYMRPYRVLATATAVTA